MYKGISTVIALETINANRAIVAINNGENPVTAFKLYGFEADEGETDQQMVEQATSKEGILKKSLESFTWIRFKRNSLHCTLSKNQKNIWKSI